MKLEYESTRLENHGTLETNSGKDSASAMNEESEGLMNHHRPEQDVENASETDKQVFYLPVRCAQSMISDSDSSQIINNEIVNSAASVSGNDSKSRLTFDHFMHNHDAGLMNETSLDSTVEVATAENDEQSFSKGGNINPGKALRTVSLPVATLDEAEVTDVSEVYMKLEAAADKNTSINGLKKEDGKLQASEHFDPDIQKEMPEKSDQNSKGSKYATEIRTGVDAGNQDFLASYDDLHDSADKGMSEFSEYVHRQGNINRHAFGGSKAVQYTNTDSEIHDAALFSHAGEAGEGNKPIQSLFMGNAARPSGFQELLDHVVYVIQGKNRLGVTVEHDYLGRLRINVTTDKGIVNVHVLAADRVTREFIESNIQYIVDTLNKDGVSVGGFSVALGNGKDSAENTFIVSDKHVDAQSDSTYSSYPNDGLVNIFV